MKINQLLQNDCEWSLGTKISASPPADLVLVVWNSISKPLSVCYCFITLLLHSPRNTRAAAGLLQAARSPAVCRLLLASPGIGPFTAWTANPKPQLRASTLNLPPHSPPHYLLSTPPRAPCSSWMSPPRYQQLGVAARNKDRGLWLQTRTRARDQRAARYEHLAFQSKLKHQMGTRRGAVVNWPIPSCPGCPTTTPAAIWRQHVARIPRAREKHGK